MKIAVIGGGGREHAIVNQLKKSARTAEIFAIPGNAGIAEIAQTIDIRATDTDAIKECALQNKFDLVFVAPDDPLALGLVDKLQAAGIRAFGPSQKAAEVEWSKAFSKQFMLRHNIPTAAYEIFCDKDSALNYLQTAAYPLVVKADGLALGKGVIICNSRAEAEKAVTDMMEGKIFSAAGERIVIEEFLCGKELTVLAFTDGKSFKLMPSSQDHKRAYDNDLGANTGGMGAFSPAAAWNIDIEKEIVQNIVRPTITGLREEGRPFCGVLYFGLMATANGVKVIEYNSRFGDPEAQTILPLLQTDFVDIIDSCIDGTLDKLNINWQQSAAVCVVVASGGYPENVVKGFPVTIGNLDGVTLIHCGTAKKDGKLVTNGGRVFCLTAMAPTIAQARERIYSQIDKVEFQNARYRKDIGKNL